MCKIEVLMSVMFQKDFSLAEKCNADCDILVINQCDYEGYDEEIYNNHRVRMISTTERGLSKSRNMAIANAVGDICILCDDGVTYRSGYLNEIKKAFNEIPQADIISFKISRLNPGIVHLEKKDEKIRKAPSHKTYSSCSLVFRLKKVIESGIRFNEDFGSGSNKITQGEESLWQRAAREKRLKIYQHPFCILDVEQSSSTWFRGYNEKYFYNLGAYLSQVSPKLSQLLKFYYIYRFRLAKELSIKQKIKWLKAGIEGYGKYRFSYEEYEKERKS